MKQRPEVLTIAGFDPSGGAGLLADIKTMEALKCYGIGICTANTIQTDQEFEACHWMEKEIIIAQLKVALDRFNLKAVKIGIVQDWELLLEIIGLVKKAKPTIPIIWDPVLSASTGFDFHNTSALGAVTNILKEIFIITPNYLEIQKLYPNQTLAEAKQKITQHTNLYLKGGHREEAIGKDELLTNTEKRYTLNLKLKGCTEKHGSGCVLSSAIASHLALKFPLLKACYRAKRYTEKVLASNKSLLGYHRI